VDLLAYPVIIEEFADADFVASFPDIPEAITGAETREQALIMAEDALAAAVEHYLEIGRAVPLPKARAGLPLVPLDSKVAARVLLTRAMAEQGLTKCLQSVVSPNPSPRVFPETPVAEWREPRVSKHDHCR